MNSLKEQKLQEKRELLIKVLSLMFCLGMVFGFIIGRCGRATATLEDYPETHTSSKTPHTEALTETPTTNPKETEKATTEAPKPRYRSLGEFSSTAYCPCHDCCHYKLDDGTWNCGGEGSDKCKEMVANPKTSIGRTPQANRTVAVDPSVIPYGSQLKINGEIYIAEDCGGAVDGRTVDIYFSSDAEAVAYGRRTVEVFILEE